MIAHRPVAVAVISYEGMDELSGLIRSEPLLRENGEKLASEENTDTKSAESQSLFTANEFTVCLHFYADIQPLFIWWKNLIYFIAYTMINCKT